VLFLLTSPVKWAGAVADCITSQRGGAAAPRMSPRLRWRKIRKRLHAADDRCVPPGSGQRAFLHSWLPCLSWGNVNQLELLHQIAEAVGEPGGGMAMRSWEAQNCYLLASLIGVPIGFLGAIYLAEFSGSKVAFVVRYAADLLNGVPSIVIGIFAYSLVVLPFKNIFRPWREGLRWD